MITAPFLCLFYILSDRPNDDDTPKKFFWCLLVFWARQHRSAFIALTVPTAPARSKIGGGGVLKNGLHAQRVSFFLFFAVNDRHARQLAACPGAGCPARGSLPDPVPLHSLQISGACLLRCCCSWWPLRCCRCCCCFDLLRCSLCRPRCCRFDRRSCPRCCLLCCCCCCFSFCVRAAAARVPGCMPARAAVPLPLPGCPSSWWPADMPGAGIKYPGGLFIFRGLPSSFNAAACGAAVAAVGFSARWWINTPAGLFAAPCGQIWPPCYLLQIPAACGRFVLSARLRRISGSWCRLLQIAPGALLSRGRVSFAGGRLI